MTLFITLSDIRSIDEHNIYADLIRDLAKKGEEIYIVSPIERKYKMKSCIIQYLDCSDWHKNVHILKVKTGNIQKTNIIEKGISTITLEHKITAAIKKYLKNVKFDLILYSTPPITLVKPISYVKKRDGARTYLMLKDIFPQNSVDLGMLSPTGIKSPIYRYFRKKETRLYALSDKIGCMSQGNVNYVLSHNPEIMKDKIEVFPNCIEIQNILLTQEEKENVRKKYKIPLDKKVFVYGGNLGKPQGIPFIIECLKAEKDNSDAFFLIVGDGTEYLKLKEYQDKANQPNFKLMRSLPKDDYDIMIASCDIGMIFLDHRFTIPNFPSRLLSYMQAGLPVLACTDTKTDLGSVIVNGRFGLWCESNNIKGFKDAVKKAMEYRFNKDEELLFLEENYSVANNSRMII